jgi:dephospho-CoA kinase
LAAVEIAARQARQKPVREKMERADWVALNDGSVEFLRRQIVHLAARLRGSAPTTLPSTSPVAPAH